ncbi:MAG: hypothetical protein KatS3mg129_1279 [Leptospiraceae bacterium]|nr:MAG: hypothetical protein KatS3mg129_1279 [Leptospiraceae bacterium]
MFKQEFEIEILDDNFKEKLFNYFQEVEKKIQKPGIGEIIFHIVYELINNAIKANLKRIFFLKKGYSFDNQEEYHKGLIEFRKSYQYLFKNKNGNEHKGLINKKEWLEALKDLGLKVRLVIDVDHNRILIYVINNTKMLPEEEKRLRESLSHAMKSKDLMDFIINYGQIDEEGEGLGLPLVILLIKDAGFKPDYFRVYKDEKNTIARIEFPLTENYIPIRERWQKNNYSNL